MFQTRMLAIITRRKSSIFWYYTKENEY